MGREEVLRTIYKWECYEEAERALGYDRRGMGEWIEMGQNEDGTHNICCSICGAGYKTRGHARSYHTRERFRFCPHCGIPMKRR